MKPTISQYETPQEKWDKAVQKTASIMAKQAEEKIPTVILDEAILPFTTVYRTGERLPICIMSFDPDEIDLFGTKTTARHMAKRLIEQTPRAYAYPERYTESYIKELSDQVEQLLQSRYMTENQSNNVSSYIEENHTMPMSNGIYDTTTSRLYPYNALPEHIMAPDHKVNVTYEYDAYKHASEESVEIYYILRNLLMENPGEAEALFHKFSKGAHKIGMQFQHDADKAVWNAICDSQIHEPCKGCAGLVAENLCDYCSRHPGLTDNFHPIPEKRSDPCFG